MKIRLASSSDGPAAQAIYEPFVVGSAVSFEAEPPTAAEMTERIVATVPKYPWLMAEEEGEVVGYAHAHNLRERAAYAWSAETSIYLRATAQGRGLGTKLYRVLMSVLSLQGYRRAFAGIALPNPASAALHERIGFSPIGVYRDVGWKFGTWHDVGWWQLALVDGGDLPKDIVSVDRLAPEVLDEVLGGVD